MSPKQCSTLQPAVTKPAVVLKVMTTKAPAIGKT